MEIKARWREISEGERGRVKEGRQKGKGISDRFVLRYG